jgi:uncharacterized protein YyaL (SSP411 family)
MVLDGWCSLIEHTGDEAYLPAARRAADFLVQDIDPDGYFRTNGRFVSPGEIKTYNCLCAWSLYRFGDLIDDNRYRNAAILSVDAALRQQQENGWFRHNCLSWSAAPLTHTIGYTLQGILEVGALAHREDFVDAVTGTMGHIADRVHDSGYLPARFRADWSPASLSSCLTGNAQLAIVAYRLFQLRSEQAYLGLGDKLVNFLKAVQVVTAEDEGIEGAIAGSFPVFGEYMRAGFPNWATKYLLDALLLQHDLRR